MALFDHIQSLKVKHAELEALIHAETRRPLPDFSVITKLKKRKLRVKEELNQCDSHVGMKESYA